MCDVERKTHNDFEMHKKCNLLSSELTKISKTLNIVVDVCKHNQINYVLQFFLFLEITVKLKEKINSYHWEDNKGQEWGWTLFRQCVRPPTCPLFFLDFSDIFRELMILPSHIAALSLSLLIYILTLLLMMVLYYRGQIIFPHYPKCFWKTL